MKTSTEGLSRIERGQRWMPPWLLATGLVALILAIGTSPWSAPPPQAAETLLTGADLKRELEAGNVARLDESAFRNLLRRAERFALVDAALLILRAHPQYEATLHRWERIDGQYFNEPDVMSMRYQRSPLAIYARWIGGPRKGRQVLYNASLSPKEIWVKEGGLLGLMTVKLDVNSSMARKDSNHPTTELGMEFIAQRTRTDFRTMEQNGILFDMQTGKWQLEGGKPFFEILNKTSGPPLTYACSARLRFNLVQGLLEDTEIRDCKGQQVERFWYQHVKWRALPADTFDPANPAYGL